MIYINILDNEGIITEKDITDATESSTEEADAEDCIDEDDDIIEPPPLPKDYEEGPDDEMDETDVTAETEDPLAVCATKIIKNISKKTS